MVSVCAFCEMDTLVPAARVTSSCRPFRPLTTWPVAMLALETPQSATVRATKLYGDEARCHSGRELRSAIHHDAQVVLLVEWQRQRHGRRAHTEDDVESAARHLNAVLVLGPEQVRAGKRRVIVDFEYEVVRSVRRDGAAVVGQHTLVAHGLRHRGGADLRDRRGAQHNAVRGRSVHCTSRRRSRKCRSALPRKHPWSQRLCCPCAPVSDKT